VKLLRWYQVAVEWAWPVLEVAVVVLTATAAKLLGM